MTNTLDHQRKEVATRSLSLDPSSSAEQAFYKGIKSHSKLSRTSDAILLERQSGHAQAGAVKAAAAALGQILAAMGPDDWPAAGGPFNRLLELSIDPRPKIRRAAHSGIANTLAAINHLPVAEPASQALLKGRPLCSSLQSDYILSLSNSFVPLHDLASCRIVTAHVFLGFLVL